MIYTKNWPINWAFFSAIVLAINFANAETVLIELGNDDSFRGASVINPASNGTNWTSVWAGAFYSNVVDINGNATAIDFGFDGSMVGGTDYFNGPSGATQSPSASVYVASALGNLGVNEAVYDYYTNSRVQIQGLDSKKLYNLTLFGSHKFNNDNVTRYTVYSDATYTDVVATVDLTVGINSNHNQDTLALLANIAPQLNDIIYLEFTGANGGDGYLNALQIEAVKAIPEPAAAGLLFLGMAAVVSVRRRS